MDWADEEKDRLSQRCGCIHDSTAIATALRRAKADGMREAAAHCGGLAKTFRRSDGKLGPHATLERIFSAKAAEIEKEST